MSDIIQPSEIHPSHVVVAAKAQVSSLVNDEVVILNVDTGVYHGVDGVAAFVWQRLNAPVTVNDLCDAVMREYDVDAERCRADIAALLADFANNGLIQISNATPA
ncbi:MAG TPA: PqqD family protein [Tepidisphaeraceae bacterium]|nr:PqqD family protein [Tepidisphaeraceae bacterium]